MEKVCSLSLLCRLLSGDAGQSLYDLGALFLAVGKTIKLMYLVEINLITPSGRPTSRRVKVSENSQDVDKVINKAHDKIKSLFSKGYRVVGGDVSTLN